MENLGRMGAEHRCIAKIRSTDTIPRDTKGMGRIINHLQAVLLRNGCNGIYIAQEAVNMRCNNCNRFIRDGCFNEFRVNGIVIFLDIHESRRQPIADNSIGCRNMRVWSGDNLTALSLWKCLVQIQSLKGNFQCYMSIAEQPDIFASQILLQFILKFN